MTLKFLRYAMTAGLAAVVDLVGFKSLLMLRAPLVSAALLSWLVAAVVNYNLTSRLVFNRTASAAHGTVFILVAAIGMGINVGVTLLCATQLGIDPTVSKCVGIAVAFFVNFWLNVLIVFR